MGTETGLFSLRDGPAARPARRRERSERVPVDAAFPSPFQPVKKGTYRKVERTEWLHKDRIFRTYLSRGSTSSFCLLSFPAGHRLLSARLPHQVPEDETLCWTSCRLWPMRSATSTTGRGSPRKDDAGAPCRCGSEGRPLHHPVQPAKTGQHPLLRPSFRRRRKFQRLRR